MEIGMPSDVTLDDPPCLRLVDTRIRNGRLHFIVYFRSWDLYNGFPVNLAGLQQLKKYMADEIGVADGCMRAISKGLHLYDDMWELACLRTGKDKIIEDLRRECR
jgi:thymidylate synthase